MGHAQSVVPMIVYMIVIFSYICLKIDNLEEIARETDNQLKTTKSCIASLNANQSSTDASMESMKETVNDRDKQIERLVWAQLMIHFQCLILRRARVPEAPKFTAVLSISCMTVPLWLARFLPKCFYLTQVNLFRALKWNDGLSRVSRWVPCWLSPHIFQNRALLFF